MTRDMESDYSGMIGWMIWMRSVTGMRKTTIGREAADILAANGEEIYEGVRI